MIAGSIAGIFISRDAVSQPSEVVVEVDGKPLYSLTLAADKTVSVNGRYGETVIEIKDRRVRVREAHCPNRICVGQGWISRGVIICLPNRLVITVGGGGPVKNIDAVTG